MMGVTVCHACSSVSQLSLLRGGYAGDYGKHITEMKRIFWQMCFWMYLGRMDEGKLTSLMEELVSSEGMLYELAALVTQLVPVSLDNSVSDGQDERMNKRHS
eukprot:600693_1